MRRDLEQIHYQLKDIAEQEATKLYRLAWRMQAHGCKAENIAKCREEASELHMTAYPERLVEWFYQYHWKYAFKF